MCASAQPTDVGKRKVELEHAASLVPAPSPAAAAGTAAAAAAAQPAAPALVAADPLPVFLHVKVSPAAVAGAGDAAAVSALLLSLVTQVGRGTALAGARAPHARSLPSLCRVRSPTR